MAEQVHQTEGSISPGRSDTKGSELRGEGTHRERGPCWPRLGGCCLQAHHSDLSAGTSTRLKKTPPPHFSDWNSIVLIPLTREATGPHLAILWPPGVSRGDPDSHLRRAHTQTLETRAGKLRARWRRRSQRHHEEPQWFQC